MASTSYKAVAAIFILICISLIYSLVGVLEPKRLDNTGIKRPTDKHQEIISSVPSSPDPALKVVPHKANVHDAGSGESRVLTAPSSPPHVPPTIPDPPPTTTVAFTPIKMSPPPTEDNEPEAAVLSNIRKRFAATRPECQVFQSQHNQESFVLANYFNHFKKPGFYLDTGANHARVISNTWYVDKCLGWKGVCVEPNPLLADELRKERGCKVFNGCVSSEPGNLTLVIEANVDVAAHVVPTDYKRKPGERTFTVECLPVIDIMKRFDVEHVDFMSLDVEGHEPHALSRFPIAGSGSKDPQVDVLTIEISTGRIQRALSQIPLFIRGFTSRIPLVGDGLFVRNDWSLLRPRLRLPQNMYFSNWWKRLCLNFEKLPQALCLKLNHPTPLPASQDSEPVDNWPPQLLEKKDFVKFMTDTTSECMQAVNAGVTAHSFASNKSQDWFTVTNYYPNGKGAFGKTGVFIDVTNSHFKEGSNTWFMEQCLGWEGVCVVFDQKTAEEYKKNRKCKVVIGCLKQLCKQLDCKGTNCATLGCGAMGKTKVPPDPVACVPLSSVLQMEKHIDVLAIDIAYGPYLVGTAKPDDVQRVDIYVINGQPTSNYKLMHWPLSVRGYGMVGTFNGADVIVKQTGRLVKPKMHFPVGNLDWAQFLEEEFTKQGVPKNVQKIIMSPTDRDLPEPDL